MNKNIVGVKTPYSEKIIFKDEINGLLEDSIRNSIRSIMNCLEDYYPEKDSPDYKRIRKCVLDSVNNYHRLVLSMVNRLVEKARGING